jgi:GT2 family glycosyltransferase
MSGRVSALIVGYRSYPEIRACLDSLRAAAPEAEVIVVDHAPDPARLGELEATYPAARFVWCAANRGFGAGINMGARLATGSLLLVLNPDTLVGADVVDRLTAWIAAHPETGVAAPLVRARDGSIEASARRFPGWSTVFGGRSTWLSRTWPANPLSRRNLLTGPHVREPIDVDWVSGVCMLIRREAFAAVGGFDEQFFLYWEDADLCRRIRMAGWRVTYVPHCSVTHVGGRSSRHRALASAVAFHRSVYRYFLKHGGGWRYALAPAVFLALQLRLGMAMARSLVASSHRR